MSYFELKKTWGFGHIQIKQIPHYCIINADVILSARPAIYGCYFDGIKKRRKYLGPDIENSLLNVKNAKQTLNYWYAKQTLIYWYSLQ